MSQNQHSLVHPLPDFFWSGNCTTVWPWKGPGSAQYTAVFLTLTLGFVWHFFCVSLNTAAACQNGFRYDNCCCFIFLNLGQYTVTKLSLGLLCIGGQNNSKHKGGVNQVWMNVPLFVFCLETSVIVPLNWTELCCPRRRHEAAEVDISEKQWFPRLGPAPPGNWF